MREPTGQHAILARDLAAELEVAARHGRTAWRVAVGVGSVLVSVAGILFFLAKNSFEAGREAQRLAGQVVTREEARQMVRDAVEPLSKRTDEAATKCASVSTCCAELDPISQWIDWDTNCIDGLAAKARVRCSPKPRLTFRPPP